MPQMHTLIRSKLWDSDASWIGEQPFPGAMTCRSAFGARKAALKAPRSAALERGGRAELCGLCLCICIRSRRSARSARALLPRVGREREKAETCLGLRAAPHSDLSILNEHLAGHLPGGHHAVEWTSQSLKHLTRAQVGSRLGCCTGSMPSKHAS